jgi:hypothetical protein
VRTYLLAATIAALAISSTHAETPRGIAAPALVRFGCLDIDDTEHVEPERGRCTFLVPWSPQENGDPPEDAVLSSEDQTDPALASGSTPVETPLVIVKPGQPVRFGCLDIADTQRIERLREARQDTAVRHILELGRCAFFVPWFPDAGETTDDALVYFEDQTDGAFGCIRPDGEDGCYWMRKTYYRPFARG